MAGELPQGFVLDQPSKDLPEGFTIDSPSGVQQSPANAGLLRFGTSVLGIPVDAVENALNLGIASYGAAKGAITGKGGESPEPLKGSVGGSEWLAKKLKETGQPLLSPDLPQTGPIGKLQYDLMARGGFIPGGALPAVGSIVAEKIGGPQWAGVGAMAPGAVGAAVKATGLPGLEDLARARMQAALKPSKSDLLSGNAAKAIDTMLEGGFNVSKGGVQKMRAEIDNLNEQISNAIAEYPATVNKVAVGNQLKTLLDRFKVQVNPSADLASIRAAWKDFMEHPLLSDTNQIPIQLAQELKKGTYRSLGNKAYGELKGADIEAQKTLTYGLKEGIAKGAPVVGPLNARESELLNALQIAEPRFLLEGNKGVGGLAWLTHNPAAWAAFMADRSSFFNSLAANKLKSLADMTRTAPSSPIVNRGVLAQILAQQQR